MFTGGTPGLVHDKAEAKRLDGRHCADHQRADDPGENRQHRQRGEQGVQAEPGIAGTRPPGGFDAGGKISQGRLRRLIFLQGDICQKMAPAES